MIRIGIFVGRRPPLGWRLSQTLSSVQVVSCETHGASIGGSVLTAAAKTCRRSLPPRKHESQHQELRDSDSSRYTERCCCTFEILSLRSCDSRSSASHQFRGDNTAFQRSTSPSYSKRSTTEEVHISKSSTASSSPSAFFARVFEETTTSLSPLRSYSSPPHRTRLCRWCLVLTDFRQLPRLLHRVRAIWRRCCVVL